MRSAALGLFCGALSLAHPALAQGITYTPCPQMSAQIAVAPSLDAGFAGLFKYTITVAWNVGSHDPSHVDLLIGLNDCVCICDPRLFKFAAVAGLSTGVNSGGTCQVPYTGEYVCKGDPSIKDTVTGPAIKFNPNETLCSTDETGTGTFVFYSPLPPGNSQVSDHAIAIKHGNATCYGPLVGPLPICNCSVPTQAASWGKLKDIYR
jgi:hypothetical protein